MKIAGGYILDGVRECIWPLIYDPASLVTFIPGCEQLEQISPDEYRGQVRIRLPAVGGSYTTYVKLIERDEPNYCRFAGEVNGAAGSVSGTATFRLQAMGARTLLEYEGQALISGPLARLDSRFVEGVAQTLIKQGLSKLNQQVQLKRAAPPAIP
jgi:carbon monoxide dehydrogenase subunit G